jgi:UDP-glucose 4-epimerase
VRFSGIGRPGDPFSLLADDAKLRRLPFDWQIPVARGLAEYVLWFKDQSR